MTVIYVTAIYEYCRLHCRFRFSEYSSWDAHLVPLIRPSDDQLGVSWPTMVLSQLSRFVDIRTEETRKKLRYATVSVVFVPIGQILIQVLNLWLHNYTTASLLQAAIITLPNFFANKHFVWQVTSRENLRSQMLVFWVAVMLGVALATLFTHLVEHAMADRTTLARGAAVVAAQLLGLGIVWVARFLILDRWLFKLAGDTPEHADEVIGELPV